MSLLAKVTDAAKKVAAHPQVQSTVSQAHSAFSQAQTASKQASESVTSQYSKILQDNAQYVVKDDKEKLKVVKTAFYTGMAECDFSCSIYDLPACHVVFVR